MWAIFTILFLFLTAISTESSGGLARTSSSCLMYGDQRPYLRHKVVGDLHKGLIMVLQSCLVFGGRLFFTLILIVFQDLSHPISVPTERKLSLPHLVPLRRRRLR